MRWSQHTWHRMSTGLSNNSTLIFYMEFPHSVMIGVMHVHPTRTSIILRHECQVPLGLRRTRSSLPIWNDSRCLLFLWHLILTRLLPDRFFNGIMPRQVKEQISLASENRKGIITWVYNISHPVRGFCFRHGSYIFAAGFSRASLSVITVVDIWSICLFLHEA